jgi:hypothetical protein
MAKGSSPHYQFGLMMVLIVVINVAGGHLSKGEQVATGWMLLPWLVTAVLLVICFAIIGRLPPIDDWRGVLIDQRNKLSLSRFQLVVWSILVISAIITEGVLNAVWGRSSPLSLAIPKELWILLGISTTAFVAAPLVLGTKGSSLDTNPPGQHAWRDIFYGDDTGNADQVDFSKVQQFSFTFVLVAVYAVSIASTLISAVPSSSTLTFPQIDAGFIGIMAVSQTAYIAYKAVPQSNTDAK